MEKGINNTKQPRITDANTKDFIIYFLFILAVLLGVIFSPVFSTIVAVCCCILVFFGQQKTIQAISILVVIRFLNPSLVVFSSGLGVYSWAILLVSSIINIPWGIMHIIRVLLPIIIFCFVSLVLSVISSEAVWISILKIVSFLLGSLTILSIFNRLSSIQIRNVILWVFSLMFVVVSLSILTLADHNIAYNLNGTGFQGVLNHPQTLGVFLAPLTSFFVGRFMFDTKRIFSLDIIIFLVLIFLILITQARTAALAVFLSFFMTLFVLFFPQIKAKVVSKGSFIIKISIGVMLLLALIIYYVPAQEMVNDFIFKRESKDITDALSSRSGGFSSQWQNFLSSPIIGHGFGVYPGPIPSKGIQYFMGIPISAAVEKGFLPTALLEEVGIIGAISFVCLLLVISRLVLRNKNPSWMCMFFASLFVNIGECVFFSTGGMGIFYWVIIGLCSVTYKKEGVIAG